MVTDIIGIEQLVEEFRVYPNPTTHSITVDGISRNSVSYHLFSNSGNLIESSTLKSNNTSIDLSNLSDGLYYLSINSGESIQIIQVAKASSGF